MMSVTSDPAGHGFEEFLDVSTMRPPFSRVDRRAWFASYVLSDIAEYLHA
jgi:hypothetical protein